MAASYLSLENLSPALSSHAPILVPNNRLRNHLLRAFALKQTAQAWLKPNIQSLSQWLDTQWQTLQDNGVDYACVTIATPLQRQIVWEAAIKNSALGATLLQPKPLAQQADSAFKNLELWQLDSTGLTNYFSDMHSNTAQFAEWAKSFKRNLQLQHCVTRETSYALIAQAFMKGDLPRIAEIYMEGFDDIPPLMQHVLQSATPSLIHLPAQTSIQNTVVRTETPNQEEEIRSAALWSKAKLAQNPDYALIGIVVPNLGQCRDQVDRIFTEVFEAHSILPATARYTLPFNFSAGTPLGATPLINSVFDILNLHENNWPLESLCNLIHSPFWGDDSQEHIARSHLIKRLRELEQLTLSTSDLRYCASKLEAQIPSLQINGLSKRFENIGNLFRTRFESKLASEWLVLFDHILETMGWPGTRRLDSQEYQQLNLWFEVRDEFAAINNFSAPVSYTQACRYLRELADKTPFQAQTRDSPIQILGALEAAGLQFSHLWAMGLNDSQWPPAPAPNPLLPLQLQREHQMPHASATRELEIAQGLTQRYRQSAHEVILSSAHTNAETELRASALIRDIPLTQLTTLLPESAAALQIHYKNLQTSATLEIIKDSNGPSLNEQELVRGGSTLFKLQAACPFEAFARLRLGAKNPDEPTLGFNAAERGNLLHDALAAIWRELKNSNGLKNLDDASLESFIKGITHDIVMQAQTRNPRKLGKVYCELEQKRLAQLLYEWLVNERERPEFNVIAIEQENTIEFSGLHLTLRIDRIDEFNNGDRLLIDYKTGSTHIKFWQGERLSEPQLPLYAITRENISAISFAQINRKNQKWDGLGELHDSSLSQTGIKPSDNWQTQLAEWEKQLQQLAQDFISGDARVDFKDKHTKDYAADLAPLTRLADADALYQFSLLQQKY